VILLVEHTAITITEVIILDIRRTLNGS
jgi:hypothetical protein